VLDAVERESRSLFLRPGGGGDKPGCAGFAGGLGQKDAFAELVQELVRVEHHRGTVLVRLDDISRPPTTRLKNWQRPPSAMAVVVLQAIGIGRHESIGHG
jgi:hypothetical protein